MADMIDRQKAMAEYIDKARFLEYIRRDPVGRSLCERHNLDGAIEAFPAADVAKIVRCKDCEYYTAEEKWCRRLGLCGAFSGDGFCSFGERRDDG